MSCSPKYEKLVEYLKTHYTYQLKLNSFALGNREEREDSIKRTIYGDIMDFVENLESEEEIKERHKNNLIPLDFSPVAMAADTVSFDFRPDTITFGSSLPDVVTLGADTGTDTLNIGYGSHVPGGMGEDHITFNWDSNAGLANTAYDEPKYYSDEHGLVAGEFPTDKDED
tara:strand:- start:31 stop:540 length:510 start_codon:yes stop_codon:yes gene_type:complete